MYRFEKLFSTNAYIPTNILKREIALIIYSTLRILVFIFALLLFYFILFFYIYV